MNMPLMPTVADNMMCNIGSITRPVELLATLPSKAEVR